MREVTPINSWIDSAIGTTVAAERSHARGATLRQKRVEDILGVFYYIGDCAFTNSGHHGTPNQRLASARFGFQMTADTRKQGHIMSSAEFFAAWRKVYPSIIAPEAK